MEEFLKFIGGWLAGYVLAVGGVLVGNQVFVVGAFAIAVIIFIIFVLVSDTNEKGTKIFTAITALVGAVIGVSSKL